MKEYSGRIFSAALSLCVIFILVFTGCGDKNGVGSKEVTKAQTLQDSSYNNTGKPYEFSVFRASWIDLNDETDPVIQELDKRLKIKIRIISCPYDTWTEKYNIYVASNTIPDLSITTGPGTANFSDWAKQGIYLDLSGLYEKYCPNIQKYLDKKIIETHKIDRGKLYGIPKPTLSDSTNAIRVDWLKKLKLPMPETLDDLYNVLKAFRDEDPDGNGKNDTYGLCSENTLSTVDIIFGAFGCSVPPNIAENWIPDGNGGLTSCLLAPGMEDAIKYITKLYREGILDQEWMLTKSQTYDERVWSGKVGFAKTSFQNMITEDEDKIKANDPGCRLAILDGVKGPGGKYVRPMQKGYYMVSSISSKAKNPVKILKFIDYLMSDEGDTLIRYGIEDLTYTIGPDGKIIRNEEEVKKYAMEAGHKFRQIMQPPKIVVLPLDDQRTPQIQKMAKVLYDGPFYPVPAYQPASLEDVLRKQGADYVLNSVTRIITGNGDPSAEWNKFIAEWKRNGGTRMIREINEIYKNDIYN